MSIIKKAMLFILVCCFSLNVFATPHTSSTQLLFILMAKQGVLEKNNSGYTLTLQTLDPRTLYFSDTPKRIAGDIPSEKFLQNWSGEFKKSAPNAGLIHANLQADNKGKVTALAFELADAKNVNGQWQMQLNPLDKSSAVALENNKIIFNDIVLFIDNAECNLLCQQWLCPISC